MEIAPSACPLRRFNGHHLAEIAVARTSWASRRLSKCATIRPARRPVVVADRPGRSARRRRPDRRVLSSGGIDEVLDAVGRVTAGWTLAAVQQCSPATCCSLCICDDWLRARSRSGVRRGPTCCCSASETCFLGHPRREPCSPRPSCDGAASLPEQHASSSRSRPGSTSAACSESGQWRSWSRSPDSTPGSKRRDCGGGSGCSPGAARPHREDGIPSGHRRAHHAPARPPADQPRRGNVAGPASGRRCMARRGQIRRRNPASRVPAVWQSAHGLPMPHACAWRSPRPASTWTPTSCCSPT